MPNEFDQHVKETITAWFPLRNHANNHARQRAREILRCYFGYRRMRKAILRGDFDHEEETCSAEH